jgi:hypothetical protein
MEIKVAPTIADCRWKIKRAVEITLSLSALLRPPSPGTPGTNNPRRARQTMGVAVIWRTSKRPLQAADRRKNSLRSAGIFS